MSDRPYKRHVFTARKLLRKCSGRVRAYTSHQTNPVDNTANPITPARGKRQGEHGVHLLSLRDARTKCHVFKRCTLTDVCLFFGFCRSSIRCLNKRCFDLEKTTPFQFHIKNYFESYPTLFIGVRKNSKICFS